MTDNKQLSAHEGIVPRTNGNGQPTLRVVSAADLADRKLPFSTSANSTAHIEVPSAFHGNHSSEDVAAILEEWKAKNEELTVLTEGLTREVLSLSAEMDSVRTSPGWKVVLRYRDWLQAHRWKRSWISRYFEPGLLWSLRRMGLIEDLGHGPRLHLSGTKSERMPSSKRSGSLVPSGRQADVLPSGRMDSGYARWIAENEPGAAELAMQRQISSTLSYRPLISVLVPVYRVPVEILEQTLDSVSDQTYGNWELCVTVCREEAELVRCVERAASSEPRIKVNVLEANLGISGNSNEALALATGDFVALLDHDDTLAPFALFAVAELLNQDPEAGFIYSDKDQLSEDTAARVEPLFKPRWSPAILWNANYLTHLSVMRASDVREVGGFRSQTDGAQDWDVFLRVIQYGLQRHGGDARHIHHIPKVLYHWRQIRTSVALNGLAAKPYADQAQIRAVTEHCAATGVQASVVRAGHGDLRLEWEKRPDERVSVICVSLRSEFETVQWAHAVAEKTDFAGVEILVAVTAELPVQSPVRCVSVPGGIDMASALDRLVKTASGDFLVFLDISAMPADANWLMEIVGPLRTPSIGLVGAKLIEPVLRTIRHCGIVINRAGQPEHLYAGQPEHVYEQFGGAAWYRNWTAVSGACVGIRREVWETVQGISGSLAYPRFDIHLSLKVGLQQGLQIVYNPYARLYQQGEAAWESKIASDRQGRAYLQSCFPAGDPHFNPNLDCLNAKLLFKRKLPDPPRGNDYAAESASLTRDFDCSRVQIDRSLECDARPSTGELRSVLWFLPNFGHSFYGGIHTILRFAETMKRVHGVQPHFCVMGRAPESRVRQQLAAAFPSLADCPVYVRDGIKDMDGLPEVDAAICTLWTTAYALLDFKKARRKFYFMQDDEALFYPAGSTSALVEATYGFGFHAICNTISLLRRYEARGGSGEYFVPNIDESVFHSNGRASLRNRPPYTVFCYTRPHHPRNSFELMAETLRKLKQRMGNDVQIITAGEEWDTGAYGLSNMVLNLGLLNYQTTGALYRACDAGIVLMMTRHPSYLPLELMACGALVVTNRNPDTGWLLKDEENCLLTEPTPTAIAEAVEKGLRDSALRNRITSNAKDLVTASHSDWDTAVERVHQFMRKMC